MRDNSSHFLTSQSSALLNNSNNEQLLRAVVNEMPDIVIVKDESGKFLLCNRALAQLYNTTPEAMIGKDDRDFGVPAELADFFKTNVLTIMQRGETEIVFEDSRDANTGEIRHFKSIKKPFKDNLGNNRILVIAHDITDVVRAQAQIIANEQLQRDILTIAQEAIWDWNPVTNQIQRNTRWYQALGYQTEDIQSDIGAFIQLIHPDDRENVHRLIGQLFNLDCNHYESEHRLLAKDGNYRWVRDRGMVLARDETGFPTRVVGSFLDITKEYQAEQALLTERENLRLIIDNAPIGIWLQDTKGQLTVVNKRFCDDTGISEAQFLSVKHYAELIPEPYRHSCIASDEQALASVGIYEAQQRLPFVDGKIHDLHVFKVVKRNDSGMSERMVGLSIDISDELAREAAIKASECRFRMLFETSRDAIMTLEPPNWYFTSANSASLAMFGVQDEQTFISQAPWYYSPKTQPDGANSTEKALEMIAMALRNGSHLFEWTHKRHNGEVFLTTVLLSTLELDGKTLLQASVRDITTYKKAESALRLSASVFTNAHEGILIIDKNKRIINLNDAFCQISGYTREEVLGKTTANFHSNRHDEHFYRTMWETLAKRGYWSGEVWSRRKNGAVFPELKTINTVLDEQGNIQNYIALYTDISDIKEQQRQLEQIAHYDPLTGQANRLLLAQRLRQSMLSAQLTHHRVAVAYLDLDGFKAINDNYGHEVGDQLLIALAKRMSESLREGDTLARIGGDEFVFVLVNLPIIEIVDELLNRLLTVAAQPLSIGHLVLQVTASLGVSFYPQREEVDADQLLRQADQAMYLAKQSGKNRYHIFDDEQDRNQRDRHETLAQIQQALHNQEFVLYYQPKVNLRDGTMIGVEALIRWQVTEQKIVSPQAFLPFIENHPLAIALGEWVIQTALDQIEQWKKQGLSIAVSVNVGALQLQHSHFVERLQAILAQHPYVCAGDLELEILETNALEDFEAVSRIMNRCQALGVSFAIDDFGTGYSSLTYLKQLPAASLKVDQSFIRDMLNNSEDWAILKAILGLAQAFNRTTIAEGIETLEQGKMLLDLGYTLGQGYAIARPMPATELVNWMKQWQHPACWQKADVLS